MTATATQTQNDFKYSLDEPIGQGIFSTTYQAIEVNTNSPVIIKTLATSLHEHQHYERFRRQFLELCDRLTRTPHPHLPKVWEYFEEDHSPYVVYDRIIGLNLAEYIKLHGRLRETQAVAWIEQIASAVFKLHQAGLKHLDIQPRNIIIRQDTDEVVLVDFGLTCELTPEIRQTHANLIAPGYAAIEQYDPRRKSALATDIYSLSATFYFMLTGSAPPPVPLLGHIPNTKWQQFPDPVSEGVQKAIFKGLSINPKDRPANVAAWLDALYNPVVPKPPVKGNNGGLELIEREASTPPSQRMFTAPVQYPPQLEKSSQPQEFKVPTVQEPPKPQPQEFKVPTVQEPPKPQPQGFKPPTVQEPPKPQPQGFKTPTVQEPPKPESPLSEPAEKSVTDQKQHKKRDKKQEKKQRPTRQQKKQAKKPQLKPSEKATPGSETVLDPEKTKGTANAPSPTKKLNKTPSRKFPVGALLMTSAIAASAGAGFGLSLRLNRPDGPGSSFWHVEQSFPPRD